MILGAKTYDSSTATATGRRGGGGAGGAVGGAGGAGAGSNVTGGGGGAGGVRRQTVCKLVTERFKFVGGGDALKQLTDNTGLV